MSAEANNCPACGALPCDWTTNPHEADALKQAEERAADLERYAALGRACESNGLGWYDPEDGEMRFQPPGDVIAEQAAEPVWAQVAALRKALEPFATAMRDYGDDERERDDTDCWEHSLSMLVKIGEPRTLYSGMEAEEARAVRRHNAALASSPPESSAQPARYLDPTLWEVEVRVSGERILTIGHSHVSGVSEPELERYAEVVRNCAEHLRSFIGSGEPTPCFACGDSGQERWMGANGEEVGPCSVCSPQTFPCPVCGGNNDDRQLMCEACGGVGLLGDPEPAEARSSWAPTHRHADGGCYRLVTPAEGRAGDGPWLGGYIYEGHDGRQWWTDAARWDDRFEPLPKAEAE